MNHTPMLPIAEPTLFAVTTPIGHLPVGARFTRNDGRSLGTVTHNDGRTYQADLESHHKVHGRMTARIGGPCPGVDVEVLA